MHSAASPRSLCARPYRSPSPSGWWRSIALRASRQARRRCCTRSVPPRLPTACLLEATCACKPSPAHQRIQPASGMVKRFAHGACCLANAHTGNGGCCYGMDAAGTWLILPQLDLGADVLLHLEPGAAGTNQRKPTQAGGGCSGGRNVGLPKCIRCGLRWGTLWPLVCVTSHSSSPYQSRSWQKSGLIMLFTEGCRRSDLLAAEARAACPARMRSRAAGDIINLNLKVEGRKI